MKIAVSGAGHGGLVCAALLSKNGYDVTVFEKKKRDELGHDWEDRFTFSVLEEIVGKKIDKDMWRFRGDCAFVSPSYRTNVVINYTDENRQKIMWRKAIIQMLLEFAEDSGVKFMFSVEAKEAMVENGKVCGLKTTEGIFDCDLVIDSSGVFSPIRKSLPDTFGIEKEPSRGDLFYAWRAYFENTSSDNLPEVPFEVYLCHDGEQGLSWCCSNEDSTDILIGRIDPLTKELLDKHINKFRDNHPYFSENIVHGGTFGIIPVRRPLSLMIGEGYAAVGDSAFMTTPMNGMGIDLSLLAGKLLAETIIKNKDCSAATLWEYNRKFHALYGGDTAKNEGLKNSLLEMPSEGVDFLFDNAVIQSSDLAGAGRNTNLSSLLGKFKRGMRNPKYFFAILGGLMKGAKLSKTLKNAPKEYDKEKIEKWQSEVDASVLKVKRK